MTVDSLGNDSMSDAAFQNEDLRSLAGYSVLSPLQSDGVQFPIFSSPTNIVSMLLGKTVNLVTWDLPTLMSIEITRYRRSARSLSGPIPLEIDMIASLDASLTASLGLDTSGLQTGNFFNGFYFKAQPLLSFNARSARGWRRFVPGFRRR